MTAPRRLFVSPSQLNSVAACERRWYLESQAGARRDGEAGGQYLVFGRLLDEAVELFVANPRVVLLPAGLVEAVKRARRPGELTDVPDEKWLELADRAIRQLRRLAGAGLLPPTGTPSQFRYRVAVPWAPVTLVGRADYRVPGRIWDLKSTSDRGPGRGPGKDSAGRERPPNAKTAESLHADFQARVYAAAEFFADPSRLSVELTWIYASSQTTAVWSVRAVFTRAETLAWFDANVRVRFPRMLELAATEGLAPEEARANHDACSRCFVRGSCAPFTGAQQEKEYHVDLEKLRARRQTAVNRPPAEGVKAPAEIAADALEAALRASQAAALAEADALAAAVSESVGAQLMAEAAAVAGGTQDDRRADVVGHAHVGPAGMPGLLLPHGPAYVARPMAVHDGVVSVVGVDLGLTPGMQVVISSTVPADPVVIDTVGVDASEAPAVALREAMAEDAAAAVEPPPRAAETVLALLTETERAAYASGAAEMSPLAAAAPRRGRGRPRKTAPVTPAEPTTRPPTAAELEYLGMLEEAAGVLSRARQAAHDAAIAAVDAASAARNALRAAGVRFEGDPS